MKVIFLHLFIFLWKILEYIRQPILIKEMSLAQSIALVILKDSIKPPLFLDVILGLIAALMCHFRFDAAFTLLITDICVICSVLHMRKNIA